jgi:hypothetical protein
MKRYFSSLLAVAALLLPVAGLRADDAFAGTWNITDAKTLDGKPYTGTVRITKSGPAYKLQWNTTAGKYLGIGLAEGNALCTGWGGKNFGVVLYKINADGTLDGWWTVPGVTEAEGLEKLTGGAPGVLEGEYDLRGTNPGNKGGYKGKLNIRKTGETYQLDWTIPGTPAYRGVGIRVGDYLHVGWGGKEVYAVISYTFDGNKAEGLWTVGGSQRIAVENLAKE